MQDPAGAHHHLWRCNQVLEHRHFERYELAKIGKKSPPHRPYDICFQVMLGVLIYLFSHKRLISPCLKKENWIADPALFFLSTCFIVF
jgi:hypothetical protein